MKLSGLTRESVLEAAQEINPEELAKNQVNSDYQVQINNQYYPFKLLTEKSYKIATGTELPDDTFKEYFYLSKQFEEFSGFKVTIAGAILLRKYVNNQAYILLSDEYLIRSTEDREMDLSVLGPSFNDDAVRKRRFREKIGFAELRPGHLFLLTTQASVYGFVQIVSNEMVERPKIAVEVLFLTPPLAHGMDFSEERYPVLDANYYDTNLKPLGRVIDSFDRELIGRSIDKIRKVK